MQIPRSLPMLALLFLPLAAQKPARTEFKPQPTQFITTPWVVGAETAARWKGLLPEVNMADIRKTAYPGQHLTLAVGAQGQSPGRDRLLADATYAFTVTYGGVTKSFKDLHPSRTWRIKAEGADFVRTVIHGAKIEAPDLDAITSMISLALFEVDWTVPQDAKDGTATFTATVTTPGTPAQTLSETTVDIWSYDRAAREGGFVDPKACNEWIMSYYQHPAPSRLLHALRAGKDDPRMFAPMMLTFYLDVLKSDPGAAADLMARLGAEEGFVRMFGYLLLKTAGYDMKTILDGLPKEQRSDFDRLLGNFPALPDPYDLSPDATDVMKVPNRLDMLWSHFLVTGNPEPVRAIAGILEWRDDGKAFLALQKSGKKMEGPTLELSKGLTYMTAGWSLSSFVRSHPLVADYVALWQADMTTPKVVKEELGTLLTNDAFKMQK